MGIASPVAISADPLAIIAQAGLMPATGGLRGARRLASLAPTRADEALRIEAGSEDRSLTVTALGRRSVVGETRGSAVVFAGAEQGTDVVLLFGNDRVEELRVLHSAAAPSEARYRIALGPELAALRERDQIMEAIDSDGRVALHTRPAFAVDARGARRAVQLRLEPRGAGYELVASFDPSQLTYPVIVDPSWVAGAGWTDEAVVALNSIWLKNRSELDGDVAVIDAAPGKVLADQAELVVGEHVLVDGSAAADSVRMRSKANVTGDVSFNELLGNQGTVGGSLLTPLALPLAITVPALPTTGAGGANVEVKGKQKLMLPAGSYGEVKLKAGSAKDPTVLTLSGGVYGFDELDLGERSRLECASACELRIAGHLLPGSQSYLGPPEASGLGAADVEVFVAGSNGNKCGKCKDQKEEEECKSQSIEASPMAAALGTKSEIMARLFAPNGTLWLKEDVQAEGTFIARDVIVDAQAVVLKDQGGPPEPDCTAYCAALVAAGCPAGPSDAESCQDACEVELAGGDCGEQLGALVVCSIAGGTVGCDAQGEPTVTGCESEQATLESCQSICGAKDDGNECTLDACSCTIEACDPLTAVTHTPVAAGTAGDDADVCNGHETCDAGGSCQGGTPLVVDDSNGCTIDACDPQQGVSHTPVAAGTACDDADVERSRFAAVVRAGRVSAGLAALLG
jgi:hypothetical protein